MKEGISPHETEPGVNAADLSLGQMYKIILGLKERSANDPGVESAISEFDQALAEESGRKTSELNMSYEPGEMTRAAWDKVAKAVAKANLAKEQ